MGNSDKWQWVAPVFMVLGIFAIYLAMTYLPLSSWGISFTANSLWTYIPWVIAFGVGLYVLKQLFRRN